VGGSRVGGVTLGCSLAKESHEMRRARLRREAEEGVSQPQPAPFDASRYNFPGRQAYQRPVPAPTPAPAEAERRPPRPNRQQEPPYSAPSAPPAGDVPSALDLWKTALQDGKEEGDEQPATQAAFAPPKPEPVPKRQRRFDPKQPQPEEPEDAPEAPKGCVVTAGLRFTGAAEGFSLSSMWGGGQTEEAEDKSESEVKKEPTDTKKTPRFNKTRKFFWTEDDPEVADNIHWVCTKPDQKVLDEYLQTERSLIQKTYTSKRHKGNGLKVNFFSDTGAPLLMSDILMNYQNPDPNSKHRSTKRRKVERK